MIYKIKKVLKYFCFQWQFFWFAPQKLYTISFIRMILCGLYFVLYIERQVNFESYYSDHGYVAIQQVAQAHLAPYSEKWLFVYPSDSVAYWAHLTYLFVLLLLFLGIGGRKMTWAAFLLHISFMHRNPIINYGVDMYFVFWLLYLSMIQNNRFFSVINLLPRYRGQFAGSSRGDLLSSVGIRFFQLQLVISYVYAGFDKLKGSTWWQGSAAWNALINYQFNPIDWSSLKAVPLLVVVATYGTLIYEIYSPFGFFSPKLRKWWIMMGVIFHLSILFMMGLIFFGLMMAVSVLIFVRSDELRGLFQIIKKKIQLLPLVASE